MFHENGSIWKGTLALLSETQCDQSSSARPVCSGSVPRPRFLGDAIGTAIVRLIDRASTTTLTVSWRDASTGHYGYQLWRAKKAEKHGICAMTGRQIEPGDAVYAPARGKHPPRNCNAMICADCAEGLCT